MNRIILGALSAFVALALLACTQPGTSSSGGGGSRAGSGAKTVLFKINGRPVSAEELLKDSHMRQAFREYVFYESLRNEAKKVGATVDEDEFTKRIAENKRNIQDQMGLSFEEYLKQQGLTEKEFTERTRESLLFEALAKARLNITDEEIEAVWKTDKESLVTAYLNLNHLPDSERDKVTFEQVKDLARDRVQMNRGMMEQGKMVSDIVINSEIELVAISPSEKKLYEDLILNYNKEEALKQREELEKQESDINEALGMSTEGEGAEAGSTAEGGNAAEGQQAPEGAAEAGAKGEDEAPAKPEPSAGASAGN